MKIDAGPWREVGAVRLGPDGKLMMPDPGPGPGIYRFRLAGADVPSEYIGESADISRRFGQYRNPGSSQRTNTRVHKWIVERIEAGGIVEVAIVTEAVVRLAECHEPLDLGRRTSRLLVEEHLVGEAREAGAKKVENIR
jgi:hypothetical protein